MVSTRRKKSLNKRMLFKVDRKSISWNGEKTRPKKCLVGISEKSKKIVANSNSDKSFN